MSDHPDLDLDAAISADLDGDLAAFAADAGRDEDEIRRSLAGSKARERREQLVAVRTALQSPLEPLDDLSRRRLLDAAGAAGAGPPARSAPRWTTRLAAAAAAAVILVGGGIFLATRSGEDTGAKGGESATARKIPSGDLGDLGVLDQSTVNDLIGGPAGSTPVPSAPGSTLRSEAVQGSDASGASGPAATADQVTACRNHYRASGTVRFTAAGSFGGTPAVIVGIANGDRTIVFVVAASDCTTVLYSASSTG